VSSSGDAPDAPAGAAGEPAGAAHDDGPDAGEDPGDDGGEAASEAVPGGAGGEAVPRRRRRRRRRRSGGDAAGAAGQPGDRRTSSPEVASSGVASAEARGATGSGTASSGPQGSPGQPGSHAPQGPSGRHRRGRDGRHDGRNGRTGEPATRGRDDRGADSSARGGDERAGDPSARNLDERGGRGRGDRRRGLDLRSAQSDRSVEVRPRGNEPGRRPDSDPQLERYALLSSTFEGPTTRLDPRRPVAPTDDLDLEGPSTPAIPWGKDDDGPPAEVTLAADLPPEAPDDDVDPLTHPLLELASAPLGDDIASVAGVRFVPGGRIQWCDAGDADYAAGERVMVEADRGTRLAWIAVRPSRRPLRDRGLRRVIRRASEQDLRGERDGDTDRAQALRIAKDKAAALRLPLKVFRVEVLGQLGRGARLNVYYTTDERLDLREFLREISAAIGGGRVELRQLGVRDEAKAVGGIGSCGLTLCCTTWLPDFVPVSIKMAKDQGLVLSPTKVSGQCGRLKCCLVYEQAAYAELRKGLPKLGKRVIAARGEGRVVEVDVLRQRIRVSYGPGDTEVVPASDVRPLFPSGNQPVMREAEPPEADDLEDTVEPADAHEPADAAADADADGTSLLDGDLDDGLEAMADTGMDAASSDDITGDSLRDLSPDSQRDVVSDASRDSSPDASRDSSPDAMADASDDDDPS
jgi:cell fate regulator YaaT (PSP1 superfamily)